MTDEQREQRILDAASDLIVRWGYDKTTVREIAEAAGVSKGTIYLHFDSKKKLFETLLVREIRRVTRHWVDCVDEDPEGGTIGSLYKNLLEAQHSSRLLQAIYAQDPGVLGSYLHVPDNLFETAYTESIHVGFVEAMQQAGVIRDDLDAQVLAHVFDILDYGFVSIAEVKNREQFPPFEATIEMIAEMMDRALTPHQAVDCEAGKAVVRQLAESYEEVLAGKLGEGDDP